MLVLKCVYPYSMPSNRDLVRVDIQIQPLVRLLYMFGSTSKLGKAGFQYFDELPGHDMYRDVSQ